MRILAVIAILATATLLAVFLWPEGTRRAERPTAPIPDETTLPTTGAPTITGTVVRGGPVADADVTLWRGTPPDLPEFGKWLQDNAPLGLEPPRAATALASTRADASGRFRFDAAPGNYLVVARAPTGGCGARPLHLRTSAAVEVVVAARGHTVRGLVRHADGNSARGFVRAHLVNGPLPFVATDANGAFALDNLPTGVISVEALVPDRFRITATGVPVPHDGPVILSAATIFPSTWRGRVVDFADDRPIAGARVVLHRAPDLVAVRTGDDGTFAVPGSRAPADIWVFADGYAPHYAQGEPASDFRLLRPGTVHGVVLAEDRPLAGAQVELRDMAGLKTTTTAADGTFALRGIAPGEVFFFARAPGWLPERADKHGTWRWSRDNPFSLTLGAGRTASIEIRMEPTVHLEGVVLASDGTPVDAAQVRAVSGEAVAAQTLTDAEGRFRIETARRGTQHVYATAPGHGRGFANGAGPFEIRLGPGRRPRVVVEAEGPVEGARIEAYEGSTVHAVWWTGQDGTVEIFPPEGVRQLRVSAQGFVPVHGRVDERPEIRFTLQRADSARVQVRFPGGRPAPGAALRAGYAHTLTGPDGWGRLGPVAEGPVRVYASDGRLKASGALMGEELVLVLKEPEEKPKETTHMFRLRIVDGSGRPVPAGRARLDRTIGDDSRIRPFGHHHIRFPVTLSFSDGVLELSGNWFPIAANSSVTIDVLAAQTRSYKFGFGEEEGAPLPLGPATIGPTPFVGEYEIVLPAEQRVSGRVVDDAGNPVAAALVWAWPAGRAPGQRPISGRDYAQYDRTRTQQDGTFELGRLGAGRVAIVVEPPRGFLPPGAVEATPGGEVTIQLARGARPVVTVTDTAGKPLPRARVQVRFRNWNEPFREARSGFWADDDDWSWRTDDKGEVRLGGLEPERAYRLRVTPPAGHALAPEERHTWKPRDTTVACRRATTIRGVVRDSRGEPRTEAKVYAGFGNGDGRTVDLRDDGTFLLQNVPEGKVTFTAEIDGRDHGIDSKAEPVVATTGDGDVVVIIELPPSVLLRMENWNPDALSEVRLSAGGLNSLRGDIQDDGRLEIVGVDPKKTWTTMIGPTRDGRYALLDDIVPSLEVRTVRLLQGGEIRGRINLPEKHDHPYLRVGHPIVRAYPEIADDGSFVLRGLPPGRWNIAVSIQTPDGTLTAEAEASPGDTVDLTPE